MRHRVPRPIVVARVLGVLAVLGLLLFIALPLILHRMLPLLVVVLSVGFAVVAVLLDISESIGQQLGRPRPWIVVPQAALGFFVSGALIAAGSIVVRMTRIETARGGAPLHKAVCLARVKNLGLALRMYAEDWDGALPDGEAWCDSLLPYVDGGDAFHCPEAPAHLECAFAYNRSLGDTPHGAPADPMNTVAIFESDAGWNAAGGPELLPVKPRHLGGDNYGFADGHAVWMPRKSQQVDGERAWGKHPVGDVTWEVHADAER
jgi:prepilin-type processing-associated H-X9-DG protein